jgi:hypothetical protein
VWLGDELKVIFLAVDEEDRRVDQSKHRPKPAMFKEVSKEEPGAFEARGWRSKSGAEAIGMSESASPAFDLATTAQGDVYSRLAQGVWKLIKGTKVLIGC